jgi:hypothetical protein
MDFYNGVEALSINQARIGDLEQKKQIIERVLDTALADLKSVQYRIQDAQANLASVEEALRLAREQKGQQQS